MTCKEIITTPFIKNPLINSLLTEFEYLREKKRQYGIASCMLITGESGSGKTHIAKHYESLNGRMETAEKTRIPVLRYELRSIGTFLDLIVALLIELGDPQHGRNGNATVLYSRLIKLIKTVELELLILDEVQVIAERRSETIISTIANMFKDLIKDTQIPIIFMGMPWSKYLIDSDRQLANRVSYRRNIPPYRISSNNEFSKYKMLLKILSEKYKLSDTLNFTHDEIAVRCFAATKGNLSATVSLLSDAYITADMHQMEINIGLLAKVIESYGVEDETNAFIVPLEKLIISELVIHSDWNYGKRAGQNSIIAARYEDYVVSKDGRIVRLQPKTY